MELIIQGIFNGIFMGCIYALITLGLSIIFGVMNIVNFAHGSFVMLSMYFSYWISTIWGIDVSLTPVITFPLLFIIGIIVYYTMIDRTLRGHFTIQLAVTVGLMTFINATTLLIWKARPRAVVSKLIIGAVQIGDYTFALSRFIPAILSILFISITTLFLNKTWPGRTMQATSDDLDAAAIVGVDSRKTYALAFGLGTSLTALAGGLLMTFQQVEPTMGIRFGLLCMTILALAGLGSTAGILISGIIVGLSESLIILTWDPRARSIIVYAIFILVIWLRPRGLFGRK